MNLPIQVQKQVEQAERALAAMQPQQEAPAEAQAPEAAPQPPQTTAPAPAPADDAAAELARLKQQNKSLQGMFRSFKEREEMLSRELAELKASMQQQQAQIQTQSQNEAAAQYESTLRKYRDEFGDDMVTMVLALAARVADEAVQRAQGTFVQRVASVEERAQQAAQAVEATKEQAFYAQLAQAVPDYEAINEDEGFLAWLEEIDPVYGQARQMALNHAVAVWSAPRVAAIFNAYKSVKKAAPKPADALTQQVVPASAGAVTPHPGNGPKIWSRQEVEAFYQQLSRGQWRGREAEANRLETEINFALAQGRVR